VKCNGKILIAIICVYVLIKGFQKTSKTYNPSYYKGQSNESTHVKMTLIQT